MFYRKETKIVIIIGALVLFLIVLIGIYGGKGVKQNLAPGPLDSFAKCLTDKGIIMYGADWCPHCQNEKKDFGVSWQYVSYIECPLNLRLCRAKEVEGYPTWIFPDGKKLVGEQGVKKLSEESGCALSTI